MIYADVQLFPDGDPAAAQHIGHMVIVNVTPTDDPADYVVTVLEQSLEIVDVRRIAGHRRALGWQELLARAADTAGSVQDAQALAVADRAQQIVIEAADGHCALGHPVRQLRRLAGDRWSSAQRAIQGRATTNCTGWLCGGTAHGEVLTGNAFEDALAAILDDAPPERPRR